MQSTCGICGSAVPYSLSAHVLIHTGTDVGVVDYDVCRSCYTAHLEPLFAESAGETTASEDVSESGAAPDDVD